MNDAVWRALLAYHQGEGPWPADGDPLIELYRPLCRVPHVVIAHLGQSLDGRIATVTGDSFYVTGPENIAHLHRLRALCDVVLVGAATVLADDPQLTVRHVAGPQPVKVVVDPAGRLAGRAWRLTESGGPVLHLCTAAARTPAGLERVELPLAPSGIVEPADMLAALASRGLRRVFVEGGGVTVSRFLAAGLLDRLHVAVAPLVIGSGRPGLTLAPVHRLLEAHRPPCRWWPMGGDMLADLDCQGGVAKTS